VSNRPLGRYLIALIGPLLLGCSTYSAVRYSPMAETVAMLRTHRGTQVNVGRFTARNPRGASIVCRLGAPIQTPDDEPFEEFVRKAFVAELLLAELYAPTAPVALTGVLDEFDFSTTEGRWKITLVLSSSNGQELTVTETYDYGFHFMGDVACRQTAHALTPAIQNLVRSAVQHPDFAGLLTPTPQTDPRGPKGK
jgi:hypothetical protein